MATAIHTRRPRRTPGRIKHIPKPDRINLGQIMTDAEQWLIDNAGRDTVSEVTFIHPGSSTFAELSNLYQRDLTNGRSDACTDFRLFATR